MIAALVSTAAMSVGSIAVALGLHPLLPFLAFGVALWAVLAAPRTAAIPERVGCILVALGVVATVATRHVFVSSSTVAPDDALAAVVVIGALILPRGRRWAALGAGIVLATYAVVGATLIAVKPYHSDAVVAAHGGAEALLAGRDPYVSFDLIAQLARFGLPPEFATPLEDGTRLQSLQYPVLAVLVPAPFLAAGLTDVRLVYLAEVLAIFAVVVLSLPAPRRAAALAACVGNLAILGQFVLAGVDPLWALLVLGAWLLRRHRASAGLLGLAIATRQPAWLVAPFFVAWTWRTTGAREAAARAGVAAGVALLLHLPVLLDAPGTVVASITAPAFLPLEPWGVGPAKVLADTVGPVVPRPVFVLSAVAAYLLALWSFARRPERGGLTLPLLPLWISWRALQSYFAFLPLFALTEEKDHYRRDAGR